MSRDNCIVIGSSHAGVQVVDSLRQSGWPGRITLIGEDPSLPYHRPTLSKDYLSGNSALDEILLRPELFYKKNDIKTLFGDRVVSIDRDDKSILTQRGEKHSYTKLAIATGARARQLAIPGSDIYGVFSLRSVEDADGIIRMAKKSRKVIIVGGGYIGLETAAALSVMDLDVTVLEAQDRILQRVTAREVSRFYTRLHQERGVEILTNTTINSIEGSRQVQSVRCNNGIELEADLVIIGVGVSPATELAENAELRVNNGIVVDEYCRTTDHDIVAAGDCSNHFNSIYKTQLRLESIQNAVDQAKVAAATLCGKFTPYRTLPWFWSNQYDIKLQIAGISQGYDQTIIRGDIDKGGNFSAFYLLKGKLLAVDAVNRPRDFNATKKVLAAKKYYPDPEKLRNDNLDIRSVLSL